MMEAVSTPSGRGDAGGRFGGNGNIHFQNYEHSGPVYSEYVHTITVPGSGESDGIAGGAEVVQSGRD